MGKKKHRKFHRRTPEEQIADLEARIAELRGKGRGKDKFSPEAVSGERRRLELSAREYGDLVGVSQLTIYSWEKGRTAPLPTPWLRCQDSHGMWYRFRRQISRTWSEVDCAPRWVERLSTALLPGCTLQA